MTGHVQRTRTVPYKPDPVGLFRTEVFEYTAPGKGYYGATFVHGLAGPGNKEMRAWASCGIEIWEKVEVGRRDFGADRIEIAPTSIEEDGFIYDKIHTVAKNIDDGIQTWTLGQFPAVYETPQKLYWRRGDANWTHLADIDVRVVVRAVPVGNDWYTFVVETTDNGVTASQPVEGVKRQLLPAKSGADDEESISPEVLEAFYAEYFPDGMQEEEPAAEHPAELPRHNSEPPEKKQRIDNGLT